MSREHEVRDAVERFLARVRQDTDTQLQSLAADLLTIVQGDQRTSRVDVERAAVDVARAVAQGGVHARHDLIARVVDAIRRLDDATTLRGILDALALGAAAEASRVAVLMVDDTMLRSWRHHGFAPGLAPPDMPVSASPLLSNAIQLRQVTPIAPSDGRPDLHLPAFMRLTAGQTGLVMPLIVGREVVAIVYADGPDRHADDPGSPVWNDQVEVLVRHASARLETVTSQRTVAVLTGPS